MVEILQAPLQQLQKAKRQANLFSSVFLLRETALTCLATAVQAVFWTSRVCQLTEFQRFLSESSIIIFLRFWFDLGFPSVQINPVCQPDRPTGPHQSARYTPLGRCKQ